MNADADRARRLAISLMKLAIKIEDPATPAGDKGQLCGHVRRLWAVAHGLDDARKDGTRRRALVVATCGTVGRDIRRLIRERRLNADVAEKQIAEALTARLADLVPGLGAELHASRDLVRALVRANHRNTGGRGKRADGKTVADATEVLCDALGLPANAKTVRRTASRQTGRR